MKCTNTQVRLKQRTQTKNQNKNKQKQGKQQERHTRNKLRENKTNTLQFDILRVFVYIENRCAHTRRDRHIFFNTNNFQ